MKKFSLCLLLMLLLLVSCQLPIDKPSAEGSFLYVAVDANGQETGEIVQSDPKGKELARFSLPDVEGFQFISFHPVRAAGIAIVSRQTTKGDEAFWINIPTGEVRRLAFTDSYLAPSYFPSDLRHYGVFYHPGPRDMQIHLAALETGEVTNLLPLLGEGGSASFGRFSPHENYLALEGARAWVLPTAHPEAIVEIQTDGNVRSVRFSPTEDSLAFATRTEDHYTIMTGSLPLADFQNLYSSDATLALLGYLNDRQLLVTEFGKGTLLLDLESGESQVLFEYPLLVQSFYPAPDGESYLFNVIAGATEEEEPLSRFYWLDVNSGRVDLLDSLTGLRTLGDYELSAPAWKYLVDDISSPTILKSIHLDTGAVTKLRTFDEESTGFVFGAYLSEDAGAAIVYRFSPTISEAFAIYSPNADLIALGQGQFGFGSVSPQGTALVYSLQGRLDPRVLVCDLQSGEISDVGLGLRPMWIVD